MFRDLNAGRSHNVKIYNSSFERVEEFKYLCTNLTKQNTVQGSGVPRNFVRGEGGVEFNILS